MTYFAVIGGFVPAPMGVVNMVRETVIRAQKAVYGGVRRDMQNAFLTGGHAFRGGKQWDGLKDTTIDIKSRLGAPFPSAPLVRWGTMANSVAVKVELQSTGRGVQWAVYAGNKAPYAKYHQEGFDHIWSGEFVPARPPVEFTAMDFDRIVEQIRAYMAGGTDARTPQRRGKKRLPGFGSLGKFLFPKR